VARASEVLLRSVQQVLRRLNEVHLRSETGVAACIRMWHRAGCIIRAILVPPKKLGP